MKCAIYGAGSLGTVLGAYLTRNGQEVELVNRNKAHVEALRKNGAHITGTVDFTTPVNAILPDANAQTGMISSKTKRGKHTTRHSELIAIGDNTYIFDTPGFSSLSTEFFELEELTELFPEFVEWEPNCKFAGCSHIGESSCGIKAAMEDGYINESRYNSYVQMYKEIKSRKKY